MGDGRAFARAGLRRAATIAGAMSVGIDEVTPGRYVSTGELPRREQVQRLVREAHERYRADRQGQVAQVYPALARVPAELFGVCVAGTDGAVYGVGDADHEFAIMSVSKPFVFALVCELAGAGEVRERIGTNATGLPFNSLHAPVLAPGERP